MLWDIILHPSYYIELQRVLSMTALIHNCEAYSSNKTFPINDSIGSKDAILTTDAFPQKSRKRNNLGKQSCKVTSVTFGYNQMSVQGQVRHILGAIFKDTGKSTSFHTLYEMKRLIYWLPKILTLAEKPHKKKKSCHWVDTHVKRTQWDVSQWALCGRPQSPVE